MPAPKRPRGEQQSAEPESGADMPRSAIRSQGPAEDTNFMEEILRELSAQNEQARSNGGLRRALREAASVKRSDPPAAPERPSTVHVERDGAFRVPEGTVSVKAYLPAKTLAPNPSAPIEIATVKVSDPRRLPTVRVPRNRGPRGVGSSLHVAGPDESVPTLRSGAPGDPSPKEVPTISARPIHAAWWVASMTLVAIAVVIVLMLVVRGVG